MVAPCGDPCGMVVEMLRTPFRQRVRPYRDRPDLECWIDWYPASKDAKALPFPTVFNSNLFGADWWEREGLGPVGYVGKANWEGVKPAALGQEPCLTPEEAVDGFEYLPDIPCERRPDGLPICCGLWIIPKGGAHLGGRTFSIHPRGGAHAGGRTIMMVTRGGARGSGRTRGLVTRGGARSSGRTRGITTRSGAWGGGFAPLVPGETCEETLPGHPPPEQAFLEATGTWCSSDAAFSPGWWMIVPGGNSPPTRITLDGGSPGVILRIWYIPVAGPAVLVATLSAPEESFDATGLFGRSTFIEWVPASLGDDVRFTTLNIS